MPSGPVNSEEWIVLPAPAVESSDEGARRLGQAYWHEVTAFSRGLVRPRVGDDGVALVAAGFVVLRFGQAQTSAEDGVVECRYPIRGGLLADGPGGSLVIAQVKRGATFGLRLAVEEYHPRLARRGSLARLRAGLYHSLQTPLHAGVSRRFLERAARGPL